MTQSRETLPSPMPTINLPLPEENRREHSLGAIHGKLASFVALLVVVVGFLLASVPATNSDVWLHLANGRLLMEGQSPAAVAPELVEELPSNQNWLYDVLSYGCYSLLGGAGLVFCKALLVGLLALLLLHLSRFSHGWYVAALCTLLALLPMSLRLLLQPATVSYLFLALTFALLQTYRQRAARGMSFFQSIWPLLLLFLVWVNVDRWFVLGLFVVALIWVGELVDSTRSSVPVASGEKDVQVRRGLAFLLLCAVCLLNPSHVGAFSLPEDLEWLIGAASSESSHASGDVTSPFQIAYFTKLGRSPVGLAYFPLLALSLISFVVNRARWSWGRFLPWLVLAFLTVIQVRTMPFFAVAAAPLMAWNFQEALARLYAGRKHRALQAERLGGVLAALFAVVLLFCAWPGWLQTPPYGLRWWGLDFSPSLARGAEAIRRLRSEGKLTAESSAMHVSSDSFRAFTWMCPEDRGKRFDRLDPDKDMRNYLHSAGVTHFVLYGSDRKTLSPLLTLFLSEPEQWPLLHREGDLAIFGWRDPKTPDADNWFQGPQWDFRKEAFRPTQAKKAPRTAPNPTPEGRPWWTAFLERASVQSIDRDEAQLDVVFADVEKTLAPLRNFRRWEASQLAALLGAPSSWTAPSALLDAYLRFILIQPLPPQANPSQERLPRLEQLTLLAQNRYALQRDDAPPELYYLAIRAARRALAKHPEDAQTLLALGESYYGLLYSTRERTWTARSRELLQLRQTQASAALNQALALRPDLARAHLVLSQLYRQMGYFDLALKHFRSFAKITQETNSSEPSDSERVKAQQQQLKEQLDRMTKDVERREDEFALQSERVTVRERALMAAQKGLAGKALAILLDSHLSAFGTEGMQLELELLLNTGRARDVREWLAPEHLEALGGVQYHIILARALAATGEYERAEEEIAETVRLLSIELGNQNGLSYRDMMALLVGQLVLNEKKTGASLPTALMREVSRTAFVQRLQRISDMLRRQADQTVLRGLLLLEEGEIDDAESAFTDALSLWKNEEAGLSGGGLDFGARIVAQSCLEWLREP